MSKQVNVFFYPSGLFEKLRKAKGDEDDLDEAEMSDELLQEENESDAFGENFRLHQASHENR